MKAHTHTHSPNPLVQTHARCTPSRAAVHEATRVPLPSSAGLAGCGPGGLGRAGRGRRRREVRLRQRGASKHLQTAPGTQWQIQVGNRRSGPVTPPIASDCRLPGAGPATAPLGAAFPEPPLTSPPIPPFFSYIFLLRSHPRDESGAHRSTRELMGLARNVLLRSVPAPRFGEREGSWGEGGGGYF